MLQIRYEEDECIEVGIDEAGRGCLWGPMYAAAVIWVPEDEMSEEQKLIAPMIKDSKKVTSQKKRAYLSNSIKDLAVDWAIGCVTPSEIDEIGMTKSNQLAFTRALANLSVVPERLLIDGTISIYDNPWSMVPQIVEPEADNRYLPVAAASLIAKSERDEWVQQFSELNENIAERYDLINCKGYGTLKHREGILEHGPHSLHRRLFLRKILS